MKNVFHYVGGYMTKWLIIATLVGVGGGLSAVALKEAINFVDSASNYIPIWIAPIIGGVLVSIIYLWDELAAGFVIQIKTNTRSNFILMTSRPL